MGKRRTYHRTAALLETQPRAALRSRRQARQVRVPWRWLALAALALALSLWLWLDPRWYMDAARVQVAGAVYADTVNEVQYAALNAQIHGSRLRAADIVTRVFQTVPNVIAADAHCWPYPAQCEIEVRERVPVLVWMAEDGAHWVAEDGVIFPARMAGLDLPQVRGPLPDPERAPLAVLDGVTALIALGAPADGLRYHLQRGLLWDDPHGRTVALGVGGERMAERLRIYLLLVADLDARGIFPWCIDVRFPEAPTYSLERLW